MKYVLCVVGAGLVLVAYLVGQNNAPSTKKVIVHDSTPTTGCSLPIAVGKEGYIKKGDFSGLKAAVVGKVDNGIDCAYSVHIQPKKQNNRHYANDVYTNVNSDNLFPINGETVR